jgi:hypothetical protein
MYSRMAAPRAATAWRRQSRQASKPWLAALVRHRVLRRFGGCCGESDALEQTSNQEQRDHRAPEAEVGQGKTWQQGNGALAGPAQITAHADRSVKPRIHQRAAVETMRGQRVLSLALRTVIRPVAIRVGNLFGVLLDGSSEGMWDLHKTSLGV